MTFEEYWTDRLANKAFLASSVYEADFRMFWNAAYKAGMMRAAEIAAETCSEVNLVLPTKSIAVYGIKQADAIRSEANNEQG